MPPRDPPADLVTKRQGAPVPLDDVGFDVDTYDYDPVGVVIDHPTPSRPPPRSLRVRRQTAPKRPRRRDIPGRSE